jgi:hypothetical protein
MVPSRTARRPQARRGAAGRVVAMAGAGVNDAAALAQADLGLGGRHPVHGPVLVRLQKEYAGENRERPQAPC